MRNITPGESRSCGAGIEMVRKPTDDDLFCDIVPEEINSQAIAFVPVGAFLQVKFQPSFLLQLAGMRPGEIFGLTWGRVAEAAAEVTQRVYRGKIDTPKTRHSIRQAALGDRLVIAVEEWGNRTGRNSNASGFVFPSERGTALSKDNVWRRNMYPALAKVGLEWANFQVMRRTHGTLMRQMKADPHAVAAQLGHTVDVSLNTYAQSPVETRVALANDLERLISGDPERCAIAVPEKPVVYQFEFS